MQRDELISLRKRLGIRQITVAKLANLDRSTLSLWECGHVELPEASVARIAGVLKAELDAIKNISVHQAVSA